MKENAQYLKSPSHCPNCNAGDNRVIFGKLEDDSEPFRECQCNVCHFKWREDYRLTGYAVVKQPQVELRAYLMKLSRDIDSDGEQIPVPVGENEAFTFIRVFIFDPENNTWIKFSDYDNYQQLRLMTGITLLGPKLA